MVGEPSSEHAAEDAEVIRLAKARLVRVCRLGGPAAEQALARAAREQHTALMAVALRVLAAIPADLAAGRVVPVGQARQSQPAKGPHHRLRGKPSRRRRRQQR